MPTLYALYRHAFPLAWYQLPAIERWLRERALAQLVAHNCNVYVLDIGDGPVGSVLLRSIGPATYEVNNFCMWSDGRGGGFCTWANFFLGAIIDCAHELPVNLHWTSLKPGFGEACNRAAQKIGLTLMPGSADTASRRHYRVDRIPRFCSA